MNEKIGIVTVLYNCEDVLKDFFDTLSIQLYKNFELIVVDNSSKDNSLKVCKDLSKKVNFLCYFIENSDNKGIAGGNNQGIKLALEHNCDKVLLSNNDIILQPDTIQQLYEAHITNDVALSVPKIFYAGTSKLWFAGGWYDKKKCMAYHIGMGNEDDGCYDEEKLITYSPTCFMLIDKEVFSLVGYMDEKYFVYWDDTDFVYRCLYKKNLKLLYCPKSTLQHKVSYSTGDDSDFSAYYMMRNRIYFAKKNSLNPRAYFIINLIYHYTIRYIKFLNKKKRWLLLGKAIKDGWKI